MGYTNKTSHYDLPQWIAGDKPSWLGDVNTAMLNIDTAIAGADASATAAESSAAAANAQVQAQEAKITKNTTDIQALTEQLADVSGVANAALPKNGGTMTGALTLSGAPTQDLQAATKKYVDEAGANLTELSFTQEGNFSSFASTLKLGKMGTIATANGLLVFTAATATKTGELYYIAKIVGNPFNAGAAGILAYFPCTITRKVGQTVDRTFVACQMLQLYYDGTNTYLGTTTNTSPDSSSNTMEIAVSGLYKVS